jgi:hypothetical protein
MIVSNARKEIQKARNIRKSLGLKVAAKYLKNRGWSVEAAVYILLGA